MPLTSNLKPWGIKPLPGMNSKLEDFELNEKWVEIAQNARFEAEPGAVDKRKPTTYYNTSSLGSGGMYGLFRYYSKGGTIKSVTIWGTSAYVGSDSAGTFTSIRANLTTSKRTSFKTYRDLIIASNGYDNPWVYDGLSDNVTWELGSCKAVTLAGGANLDASANYYYAVTMDNDAYVCGAVSNTVTTGGVGANRKVTLSNIPTGPLGTANRKIYRTVGGGAALLLLATIADNTTTTYVDDIADGTLGAAMPVVTDDMPLGNILQLHRDRLFITGDPNNPNRVYYSDPYLPWFIQQTTNLTYMDIDADDGDRIQGIPIQLGIMVCIKRNTIRKVFITSPTSGADPTTWYAEDPIAFTGSPSPWSIVQTQRGIVFLGWDHWKLFDGSAVTDIIDEFDTADILPALYQNVVCYWLEKDILLAAYCDTTIATQYNNRLMQWNFRRSALSYDTLNVNCISAHTGEDETGDVLYGDSNVGYVYKTETANLYYKLQTKTQENAGTKNTIFAGGTESFPNLQIGSVTSAAAIPNDVCVFWSDDTTNPGTGWTEITGIDGRLIKITTDAVGTTGTVGETASGIDSVANYVNYRIFKKNGTSTEYQFPIGSIVMWDQPFNPTGYVEEAEGYYISAYATGAGSTGSVGAHLAQDASSNTTLTIAGSGSISLTVNTGYDFLASQVVKISYDSSNYMIGTVTSYTTLTGALVVTVSSSAGSGVYSAWTVALNTGGTSLDNVVKFRFIKRTGEEDTWDGVSSYVYCIYYAAGAPGSGFSDVTSTYEGKFLKSDSDGPTSVAGGVTGTAINFINLDTTSHEYSGSSSSPATGPNSIDGDTTSAFSAAAAGGSGTSCLAECYSDHTFSTPLNVDTIYFKASGHGAASGPYSSSASAALAIYYKQDGDVNWTVIAATHQTASGSDVELTDATTYTVSLTNVVAIRAYAKGFGQNSGSGSSDGQAYINEVTANGKYKFVTFRLVNKVLGQMQDYNAALTSAQTNGTWVSPGLQVNAETLGSLYWNESKLSTDDIELFTRTGATQASVENGTAITTVTNATNKFTLVGNGLSNTDRITIGGTVLPTGIVNTRVYFVVGVSGNDWQVSLTSGGSAVDFSTDGTAVTFKKWSAAVTNPNGSPITSTANVWIQYLVAFTAADTTVSNPKAYFVDGYVVKFDYAKGKTYAETAVEFRYKTGYRHFDDQWADKIFKKILSYYTGTTGQLLILWETENDSGTFTVDLSVLPSRFESFFPPEAYGRKISIEFYKNDLNDFRLKELSGLYTPEPVII